MMSKRKRGDKLSNDDIEEQLLLAIGDSTSPEMAIKHLMHEFDIDWEALKAIWMGMNDSVVQNEAQIFSLRKGSMSVSLIMSSTWTLFHSLAWTLHGISTMLLFSISAVPEFLLRFSETL
jgi:hypothetical protein